MSKVTKEKTFTQLEVNVFMERHRKGLQQKIVDQEQTIRELRRQLTQLTVPETNPLVRMLLSAIGFTKGAKRNA